MKKENVSAFLKKYYSIWVPLAAFFILCVIKALIVLPMADGPIAFGDELGYKKYSLQWFTNFRQEDPHYPMMYPLSITFSFLFDDWYMAMKVLNIIYSSTTILVLYAISRLYLDKKTSTFVMLVGASLPYHFIFPSMVLSENLFFPLFLLGIYLALWEGKKGRRFFVDILLGIVISAICLTRYIGIMVIPVFALVWLMKQLEHKTKWGEIIGRGMLIIASIVISYLPWYLNNCEKYPFKEIIGFGIAKKTNPEQLTFNRLLLTAGFYVAYFIILAIPVLTYLIYSLAQFEWKKLFCKYNQLWVMVYGLSATFFVAVTRHSWRASYNYPTYWRIMGRYLIFFPILYILLAYVTKTKMDNKAAQSDCVKTRSKVLFIFWSVCAFCLIVLSYLLDIKGTFYPLTKKFLSWKAAIDGYKLIFIGDKCLIGIAVILVVYIVIQLVRNKYIPKYAFLVMTPMLILYNVWGMDDYYDYSHEVRQTRAFASIREMNEIMMHTEGLAEDCEIIYDLDKHVDLTWESKYLKFFGNINYAKPVKITEVDLSKPFYVVCDMSTYNRYLSHVIREIGRFERHGDENILLYVDGMD